MKTFTEWVEQFEGEYDDLMSDYGLSDEDIIEARRIFNAARGDEGTVVEWLQGEKGLSYDDARSGLYPCT